MDKTNYVLIECKYYNKTFDFNDEYKANFINKIDEYKKDLNKKKIFIYPLFISMFGTKNRTSFNYKNLCLNDLIDNYCLHLRKM